MFTVCVCNRFSIFYDFDIYVVLKLTALIGVAYRQPGEWDSEQNSPSTNLCLNANIIEGSLTAGNTTNSSNSVVCDTSDEELEKALYVKTTAVNAEEQTVESLCMSKAEYKNDIRADDGSLKCDCFTPSSQQAAASVNVKSEVDVAVEEGKSCSVSNAVPSHTGEVS